MIFRAVFDYSGERGLAYRFRQKRAEKVRSIILDLARERERVTVLDIGGTEEYWRVLGYDWLRRNQVEITLLNVSVQATKISSDNTDIFRSVSGDGCDLVYPDREFDLCFSNSVIEHVGDFARMSVFAKEVRRVAHGYYCQTPNFWFPIEPHFLFAGFHYLPEPVRVFLLRRFTLGHHVREPDLLKAWEVVQSARLIDARAFAALFGDADIIRERFLLVFTKSLVAVKEPSVEPSEAPSSRKTERRSEVVRT